MKVTSQTVHHSVQKANSPKRELPTKNLIATGTGISIRHKGAPENVIQKNDPSDPLVAKKILDSLDLGLINFDQRERDGIAAILTERAEEVKAARS